MCCFLLYCSLSCFDFQTKKAWACSVSNGSGCTRDDYSVYKPAILVQIKLRVYTCQILFVIRLNFGFIKIPFSPKPLCIITVTCPEVISHSVKSLLLDHEDQWREFIRKKVYMLHGDSADITFRTYNCAYYGKDICLLIQVLYIRNEVTGRTFQQD